MALAELNRMLPYEAQPKDYFSAIYLESMGVPLIMDLQILHDQRLPSYMRACALGRLSEFVEMFEKEEEGELQ